MAIQKSSRLIQDLVHMVNKTSSMSAAPPSSSSDISNRPLSASTPETSRSESITTKLEIPETPIAIVKTESLPKVPEMSSLLSNSEQYKPIAGHKSDSKPTIKTEPQLTELSPWEMRISKQHDISATPNSPSFKSIKTEPQLTAVSPSEIPETFASPHIGFIPTIKTEPQLTVINSEMTSPPSTSKPFKIASIKTEPQLRALYPEMSLLESDSLKSSSLHSDHKAISNTELTLSAMTSPEILKTSACLNSTSVASKETDPQGPLVTPSDMSSLSSSSEQMETAASVDTANIETNQTKLELTTETLPEVASLLSNSEEAEANASYDARSKYDKASVLETSPTTRLRSSKSSGPVSSTSSLQMETTIAQSPADINDETSDIEYFSSSPADSDYEPPETESSSDSDFEPPKSHSKPSRDSYFEPPKSHSKPSRDSYFEPPKSHSKPSRDSYFECPEIQSQSSVDNNEDASSDDASAEPSSPDGSKLSFILYLYITFYIILSELICYE